MKSTYKAAEVAAPELALLAIEAHGALIAGNVSARFRSTGSAAHYVSDLTEFSGIVFPTKRRIFARQPDSHSVPEPLVVSIDQDHFVLS